CRSRPVARILRARGESSAPTTVRGGTAVRSRISPGMSGLALCVLHAASAASAQSQRRERITLEVALTAGRDPNVNVVQDYGEISWAKILEQEFQKEYPYVDVVFRTATIDQVTVLIATGQGTDIINGGHTDFI